MSSTNPPLVPFARRGSLRCVVQPEANRQRIDLTDEPFALTRLRITALEVALAAAEDTVVAEEATLTPPCSTVRRLLMDIRWVLRPCSTVAPWDTAAAILSPATGPLPRKVRCPSRPSTQLARLLTGNTGFAPPQFAYPDPSQQQMPPAQVPPQQPQGPPAQGGRGY